MTTTIDDAICRIRAYAQEKGWTKSRLAQEAGMGDTTLRDFDTLDWNPQADTLRRLEAIIPADFFQPSDDGSALQEAS